MGALYCFTSSGTSSFTELEDTVSINQDVNGTVNLEIGSDSAETMRRDEELTLETLRQMREEFAQKYGQEVVTQEEVDEINEEYQAGRSK